MREVGERLRDADQLLERVVAEVRLADVRLAPGDAHPQRDRAAVRVPDHAAGRLGREHGDRAGVDQPRVAQVAGAGRAAGLLVAHEVQDDAGVAEQAELARRERAVEHADEPALHVGGAAPDDPPAVPQRTQLRRVLHRHDVEVAVEVDRARAVADAAADDARLLERAGRRELDQLRGGAEPLHRRVQHAPAAAEPAPRRVLRVDGDELLDERRHLAGARVEPRMDSGGGGRHGPAR